MLQKNLFIIPALVIAYFLYQFVFIGSDEKQIKNLFKEIKELVYIDGTLRKPEILGRTLKLKKLIAKDVKLIAFEGEKIIFETQSFDSVQGASFVGANYLSEHSAILQDFDIEVDGNKASTQVVIISDGKSIESDTFRELFSAKIKLEKREDQWVIISASGERLTSEYE